MLASDTHSKMSTDIPPGILLGRFPCVPSKISPLYKYLFGKKICLKYPSARDSFRNAYEDLFLNSRSGFFGNSYRYFSKNFTTVICTGISLKISAVMIQQVSSGKQIENHERTPPELHYCITFSNSEKNFQKYKAKIFSTDSVRNSGTFPWNFYIHFFRNIFSTCFLRNFTALLHSFLQKHVSRRSFFRYFSGMEFLVGFLRIL